MPQNGVEREGTTEIPVNASRSEATTPRNDSSVLALHEILFEEVGEGKISDKLGADVREYKALATQAREARAEWVRLDKKSKSKKACENACERMNQAEKQCLVPLFRILHSMNRSALCLSGGGIRSATFALGVIHALAKYSFAGEPTTEPARLLTEFDYLSTVSGGGYIGSWLSAWIKREGSADAVVRQLAQTPTDKLDPEPKPLLHLRDYSNYLNPRLGIFSADTWTLAATTIRNMLLNWLVLIPFLAAVLLLPVLFAELIRYGRTAAPGGGTPLLMAGFLAGAVGAAFILYNLPSFGNGRNNETKFLWFCLLPLTISAVCLTAWWGWQNGGSINGISHGQFAFFGAAMHTAGMAGGIFLALLFRSHNFQKGQFWFSKLLQAFAGAVTTGAFAAWLLSWIAPAICPAAMQTLESGPLICACFGVPLVLATIAVVGVLSVGISSKITDDDDREWWSRAGAWILIVGIVWLLLSALVLLLPVWLKTIHWQWSVSFSALSGVLGWLVSRLGASDKSGPETPRSNEPPKNKAGLTRIISDSILPGIAVVFLATLCCCVVLLNDWLTRLLSAWKPGLKYYLIVFELILAVGMSYLVNVNKFSLHAMYRMRLVRAYLAAFGGMKKLNPFTGFDLHDNLPMQELSSEKPMQVLNLCLNLVRGSKLAWQQRKAEPFTVTRLHAGSLRVGYQRAAVYAQGPDRTGITLGTAMTVSGAAASPNMGYHSSPLTALVMTLFNARLGWWLANPGEPGRRFWKKNGPAFGIRPMLDEALGNTTDANRYVYLSDGGHFENLGLYEMVLRRCRFIVVVDAGADPAYTKEDLGNAVRKIRIDLGIPIEFPNGIPTDPAMGENAKHCALGRILYDCVDRNAPQGYILYLKPLLTGDEPADVLHYRSVDPEFPQQSTADQWFDESQFESYRRLGAHTIESILGTQKAACTVADLINSARTYLGLEPSVPVAGVGSL